MIFTNRLKKPELFQVNFEDELGKFITFFRDSFTDTEKAEETVDAINDPKNTASILVETFIAYIVQMRRDVNEFSLQMLARYATGENLDRVVSQFGLQRQVFDSGEPEAIPPIPPSVETDSQLRQRYFLAPSALGAGTRLGYKFNALTNGEKPLVTVQADTPSRVTVSYDFSKTDTLVPLRDADARQTSPGEVTVVLLGFGVLSDNEITQVQAYLNRPDVGQENEKLVVKRATIQPIDVRATIYVNQGPDAETLRTQCEEALKVYFEREYRLGGRISRNVIGAILYNAGAEDYRLDEPVNNIDSPFDEAPKLGAIAIDIEVI